MQNLIHRAERRAVPGLIGIAGPSGSGKTFSALLLAAGLCDEGKRIGLVDTEKGRGEHYADNPTIKANLPDGYDVLQLDEPYSPQRYYDAILAFQKAGNYGVVIIDSATHEWEGFGGCQDIADNNKIGGKTANWALAKKEHKRFMRKALTMPFHVIFCIRAQEKTAVNMENGKAVFTDLGLQPVQEKNFKYEMLIACMLDPKTKFPIAGSDFHKVPEDLQGLFQPGRYISRTDGANLKKWISGGAAIDAEYRTLAADFKTASNDGMVGLKAFWDKMTKAQQKMVAGIKDECKAIAAEADRQANENSEEDESYQPDIKTAPVQAKPEPKKEPPKSKPVEKKEPPKAKPEPKADEVPAHLDEVPPVDDAAQNAIDIANALEDQINEQPAPEPEPEPEPQKEEEQEEDKLDLF